MSNHPKDIQFHGQVTVGSKGQVVIPKEVREMLDIHAGDSMAVITKAGRAVGLVKSDNMQEMLEYISNEMKSCT